MRHPLIWISAAALLATGCSKSKSSTEGDPGLQAPRGLPAASAPTPSATPVAGSHSGKVSETMSSGGYTYALVESGGGSIWAAAPETKIAVGDQVSFAGGSPMANYRSKTLNRTFDLVYFVPRFNVGGASTSAAGPGVGAVHGVPDSPHSGTAAPAPTVKVEGIAKAEGGNTVAEVFAKRTSLAGKEIVLRGKIVKYNANIMGKNWLHVQDGSGTAGTNDLTVTTADAAELGDTVLVRGTISIDKDFGAGYNYSVIIENAKLTRE